MRITDTQSIIIIICVVIGTLSTRALPFILFPDNKEKPKLIVYLSQTIPAAVMGLLVVFCLKSVSVVSWPHGLPEVIAITITTILHLWRRNVLISILAGTVIYMVLVQVVFI